METLKYKDYEGTAEIDMERGTCHGKILFIADLVTYQAETPRQLQAEFEAAVEDYLETCAMVGKEPQKSLRGQFNVRISPALHRAASLRACQDDVSLNEVVVRALDAYLHARAEVKHYFDIKLQMQSSEVETLVATASDATRWTTKEAHVPLTAH